MAPTLRRSPMRGMAPYMLMRTIGQPGHFTSPVNGERPGRKKENKRGGGMLSNFFSGGGKKEKNLSRVQDSRFPAGIRPGMVPVLRSDVRQGVVPVGARGGLLPMVPSGTPPIRFGAQQGRYAQPQGRFAPVQQPVERIVDRKTGVVYVKQLPQVRQLREAMPAPAIEPAMRPAMRPAMHQPMKKKLTLQERGEKLKTFLLSDEKAGWG